MPKQIASSEQFEELLPKATECRVVRSSDSVKLKLRTPAFLYTFVTNDDVADDLLKRLKDIEIVDYTPQVKEKEKEKKTVAEEEQETEEKPAEQKKKKASTKKSKRSSRKTSEQEDKEK